MGDCIVESEGAPGSGDRILGEDVTFLPKKDSLKNGSALVASDECRLLTKDDLIRLDREQPVWRRIRIALIALFWIVWILLLVASVLIIVFSPKCPPRPTLQFWQSKAAYWLNPFTFKDSDGDLVGDLNGLSEAADYIADRVGAGFVILTPLMPWYPTHLPAFRPNYESIHPTLGTMKDFTSLLRTFKKRGIETVISLDFNGIPTNHEWAGRPGFLIPQTSSMDDVVKFWLGKGVDGILLSDAAFFVEDSAACAASTDWWYSKFPSCKLFTNGTLDVVNELRKVVDEFSASSGRPKVLIADAGNTGYGVRSHDDSLFLAGTGERPGAHMVINRYFTLNRGWKLLTHTSSLTDKSIGSYIKMMNSTNVTVGLATASPSITPSFDLMSTVATFLLPGTPIIYYGSELGITPSNSALPPDVFYPFGIPPQPNNGTDSTIGSSLPMPWDSSGKGFSDNSSVSKYFEQYLSDSHVAETVEAVLAANRGPNTFSLTTSLLRLRKEYPSLQWGRVTDDISVAKPKHVEIFKRAAEGFPSVVTVVLSKSNVTAVIDFSPVCEKLVPIFTQPPSSLMELKKELSSNVVYLEAPVDSVYVFQC
ncbi:maltose alpha-glucosidase activity [Sparganum proliferum]